MCFSCAGHYWKKRRKQLTKDVSTCFRRGGSIGFLTISIPHQRNNNLSQEIVHAKTFMQFVMSRATVSWLRNEFGYEGKWTIMESPFTKQGWAPHHHIFLFFDRELEPSDYIAIEKRFRRQAEKKYAEMVNPSQLEQLIDFQQVKRHDYIDLVLYITKGILVDAVNISKTTRLSLDFRTRLIKYLFANLNGVTVCRRDLPNSP